MTSRDIRRHKASYYPGHRMGRPAMIDLVNPPSGDQHKFTVGQRAAVASAFELAGYEDELVVAPITSEDERIFLLEPAAFAALKDRAALEQILTQLLGRKVWVAERTAQWGQPIPFQQP